MHMLYPSIKPYANHQLKVDEVHELYVEETGNPEGIPVIVLHSGPGGGGDVQLRRYFDPEHYRIIIFDQRGCGRSTPHASLINNTTENLIEDIHTLQKFLALNTFILFGGGWGSLLALLYAQKYPEQVNILVLHQIYLGRKQDVNWFYNHGANNIYPDYWQEFVSNIPLNEQSNIPLYYHHCLQGNNELARMAAAKNWALWQAHSGSIQPHASVIDLYSDPHFALALAALEAYYITNGYFIEENQVLNNIKKVQHIPCYLIHGRYDVVCPLQGAWSLHQALPASTLRIVRDAGHSDREAGMIDALIFTTQEIAQKLSSVG